MASSKADPHPSGSRVPIALIFSGKFLQHFVPDTIKREFCKETKQGKHDKTCSIQHSHLGEMNRSYFTPWIKLLALLSRRCPSLLRADRSLFAGADSCCCCCFRVLREVFAVVPCCCQKFANSNWRAATCDVSRSISTTV